MSDELKYEYIEIPLLDDAENHTGSAPHKWTALGPTAAKNITAGRTAVYFATGMYTHAPLKFEKKQQIGNVMEFVHVGGKTRYLVRPTHDLVLDAEFAQRGMQKEHVKVVCRYAASGNNLCKVDVP